MPRTLKITKDRCTVCSHPERHRIELLRLGGSTAESIAQLFGLHRDAIYRHMAAHVDAATKAEIVADVPIEELAERAMREGRSLMDYLSIIRHGLMSALQRASAAGEHTAHAALAKRAIEVNREIGRLTGELLNAAPVRNYVQNNITFSDPNTMDRMEAMLIERLQPFPGALQAVQAGLLALSAPSAPMIDVTPHGGSHVV